jgi:hypothetical protein
MRDGIRDPRLPQFAVTAPFQSKNSRSSLMRVGSFTQTVRSRKSKAAHFPAGQCAAIGSSSQGGAQCHSPPTWDSQGGLRKASSGVD